MINVLLIYLVKIFTMKKILLLCLLISANVIFAQSNKIIVEIDNSQKYNYESAYYQLEIDATNKKTADKLKTHAATVSLELYENANYLLKNGADFNQVDKEVLRLKNYINDILALIPLIKNDNFDGSTMFKTVQNAYDQYALSIKSGEFKRIGEETMINKALKTYTDEDAKNVAVFKSGKSYDQLFRQYKNSGSDIDFISYLKNIIKEILISEHNAPRN